MDGALVHSERFITDAAILMFAEKGHVVLPEDFRPFTGTGEDRFIGGVAEGRGITLDVQRAKARTYEIYLELIHGHREPIPGARRFVAECHDRGLRLAVASGADAIKVEANLREAGFPLAMFDALVTGSDIVRKKPAPDIFREAARRLGIDTSSCLVVEDAVVGVTAAKASGARCLALSTSFRPEELAGADWVAPDLAEAPLAALDW